jgi:very-short-patch-repair endonuclease
MLHSSLPLWGRAGVGARHMQNQATSNAQRHARTVRREMTDSERKLWYGLRSEQLGVKFRRQHPLGNYVADFACLAPKLIVELDGSQHMDQAQYDARRDGFFREQGFAVLRFPTDAPFRNFDGVREAIVEQLRVLAAAAPTPTLPQRGRE